MGLFKGDIFHHGGVARKQLLILSRPFPLLKGALFQTLLVDGPLKNLRKRRPIDKRLLKQMVAELEPVVAT